LGDRMVEMRTDFQTQLQQHAVAQQEALARQALATDHKFGEVLGVFTQQLQLALGKRVVMPSTTELAIGKEGTVAGGSFPALPLQPALPGPTYGPTVSAKPATHRDQPYGKQTVGDGDEEASAPDGVSAETTTE